MKKILYSMGVVLALGAAIAGGTGAFFSDVETSSGNTFTAGAIDLKIGNESYYNGVLSATTTWEIKDLTIERFFDFLDIKPGDRGEDTIALRVDNNDSYLCANVKLTSNDDNDQTEPEALVDANGTTTGELAGAVNFVWWADDGDNVLESDENVISQGPIGALGLGGSTTVALADATTNIWTGVPGPVPGAETLYIGKAWCFGTITPAKLTQDGLGTSSPRRPSNSSGGIACDGSLLDNSTQTDSLTADVVFSAVQSRNNPGFQCIPPHATGTLTVVKTVINDNGGNNVISDFHFFVDDGFVATQVFSGVTTTVPTATYTVTETGVQGYVATFSGDCDSDGSVTIGAGEHKVCFLTNNDLPANITLIKNVVNNSGGTATAGSAWGLKVDGATVSNNTSVAVLSNVPHTINETGRANYHFVGPITGTSTYGKSCPAVLGGSITLDEGETIVCTITNEDN